MVFCGKAAFYCGFSAVELWYFCGKTAFYCGFSAVELWYFAVKPLFIVVSRLLSCGILRYNRYILWFLGCKFAVFYGKTAMYCGFSAVELWFFA